MDAKTCTWNEKRYNAIALKWLAGAAPDSTAAGDLRTIAQTCLSDGGRAVLGARGLCETWLKEHYGEKGCLDAPQERSARPGTEAAAPSGLTVVPNPASDAVLLRLDPETGTGIRQVRIFSVSGQQVFAGTLPPGSAELRISVANWPEGMYIAKTMTADGPLSRTFVVQHRR